MAATEKVCECLYSGDEKDTLRIGLNMMIDEYIEDRAKLVKLVESRDLGSIQREDALKILAYHDKFINEARTLLQKVQDTPICLRKEQQPSSGKRP